MLYKASANTSQVILFEKACEKTIFTILLIIIDHHVQRLGNFPIARRGEAYIVISIQKVGKLELTKIACPI